MNKAKFSIVSIREYFPSKENPSPSSWVLNQAQGLQYHGIDPLVISPTPYFPRALFKFFNGNRLLRTKPTSIIEDYRGVKVIRPAYLKLPNDYFLHSNISRLSNALISSSKCFNFNLIHAHFGHAGIAAINLKRTKKIPLITSFYGFDLGSDKLPLKEKYRDLAKAGDLFLALSSDMRSDLLELGFDKNRILIHHLGVDLKEFCPKSISKEKQLNTFTFLLVASFVEKKGIHFAIEAFKHISNSPAFKAVQLRIVGDGPYKNNLYKLARGFNNIVFVNNFEAPNPRLLVQQEMQNCDVFILPSITLSNGEKEGTPVVLMEAQASGKPCISTYHAGIPEVVIHNNTGILVKEKSVKELVEAMSAFLNNNFLVKEMGNRAIDHINYNFNSQTQNLRLSELFNSIIK
jgi:colanic acid/amylovoran biosynthesis glycosyltransferase